MATRKGIKSREAAEVEQLFEQFKGRPALLTERQIKAIESELSTGTDGALRRCALAFMLKSGEELLDLARDRKHAVTLAMSAQCAKHSAKRLRDLAELLEIAEARLLMALVEREDMQAIVAEGKSTVVAEFELEAVDA